MNAKASPGPIPPPTSDWSYGFAIALKSAEAQPTMSGQSTFAAQMSVLRSPAIPGWVPPEVAGAARMMTSNDYGQAAPSVVFATGRLLHDERMKSVWKELGKRQRENYRPTDRPLHQSSIPRAAESWRDMSAVLRATAEEHHVLGDDAMAKHYTFYSMAAELIEYNNSSTPIPASHRHGAALALFFCHAVAIYSAAERAVTERDIKRWESSLRDRGLNERADAVRSFVTKPEVARIVVKRQRTDPRLKAFIEGLALRTREVFLGNQNAGLIAITANVLFEGSDLNRHKVRAVLRERS